VLGSFEGRTLEIVEDSVSTFELETRQDVGIAVTAEAHAVPHQDAEHVADHSPSAALEGAAADLPVRRAAGAAARTARTGQIGDRKIFAMPVRVRSGEKGEDAP